MEAAAKITSSTCSLVWDTDTLRLLPDSEADEDPHPANAKAMTKTDADTFFMNLPF